MLRLLCGREHEVLTGVALREDGRIVSAVEATRVHVLPLSAAEIDWYVASGEPADKAGAYAVQGLAVPVRRPDRRLLLQRRRPARVRGSS